MPGGLAVPSAKAVVSNRFGVQICNLVTGIDTKKSSTTQGGGRRIFTIHELRLVVKVMIFNLREELEMKESCRRRGWQRRAFQLRG